MGSYCQYCGAGLAADARYCPDCGEPVDGGTGADGQEEGQSHPHGGDAVSDAESTAGQQGRNERGNEAEQTEHHGDQDEWGSESDSGQRDRGERAGQPSTTDRAGPGDTMVNQEETGDTTVAAITHLLGLFTWVLGPLVVYIVTDDPFVKENAANATNWQIILAVYLIVSAMLVIVLVGFLLLPLVAILDLVFCIIAAVKASDGEAWSYPLTPDLL